LKRSSKSVFTEGTKPFLLTKVSIIFCFKLFN
jgi:hypothetical protein